MRTTLLTVILPVHRLDDFLTKALKSVENDLPSDSEILVVLNGEAIDAYKNDRSAVSARSTTRFLFSYQPGLVAALNLGINSAKGEFIARMDGDDESLPGRFASQLSFLRGHPRYSVIGTQFVEICRHGVEGSRSHLSSKLRAWPFPPINTRVAHPTAMYRRQCVLDVGGYRDVFPHVEDQDLWLRLLRVSKLGSLKTVFLKYRVHPNQVSALNARAQKLALIRTYLWNCGSENWTNRLLQAETATDFKLIIWNETKISRFKKAQLSLVVSYWEFANRLPTGFGSQWPILIRKPVWGVVHIFANWRAIGKLFVKTNVRCRECS
jgi:glycosyltransferase involved in cell wall biosynthesis